MGTYISARLGYHEGDPLEDSVAVPPRPSLAHEWDGEVWVLNPRTNALQTIAAIERDQSNRMTPRARRELDLGVIAGLRLVGQGFAVLAAALNNAQLAAVATPLQRAGKTEDKDNPGTWIDTPGVAAMSQIQADIEAERANL